MGFCLVKTVLIMLRVLIQLNSDLKLVEREVRKGRTRKLTDEEIHMVWDDMKEEILNGRAVYEEMIASLGLDNDVFKVFKEDDGR